MPSRRRRRTTSPALRALSFLGRRWWLVAAGAAATVAVAIVLTFLAEIPLPETLPTPQSSKLFAADGQQFATLHGEENRTIVPLPEISLTLRRAVVATEDRRFYTHAGVSLRGIVRAFFSNVREGAVRQGGSTLTQQYVRNALAGVGKERTVFRKLKEAVLAIKIEQRYSKDKILELYLNTVYFGRGAYGAEAAARTYFKKSAADLAVGEAAYLAGAIRAPERYQPERSEDGPLKIRNEVIGDMVQAGYLAQAAAEEARAQPLDFSLGGGPEQTSARAAFFVEYVRRLLKEEFKLTDGQILGDGLRIYTTLDLRMQDAAEKAIASTLDREDDPESALVAMDRDGHIRAMVGGRQFQSLARARGFNFAYQKSGETGGRQAGSAFKPFTLAAFVEDGYSVESRFLAPSSVEIASPQCLGADKSPWKVSSFDDQGFGVQSVVDATARSVNTVYAQMVDFLTPRKVADMAKRAGGWDRMEEVCSITLGTPSVSPLEMARAFATFAGRGQRPEPLAVTKIVAADGRILGERSPRREQVMTANVADTVNRVLVQVLTRGTARGKGIGRPAAGKTGTTQNHVDAWFVGYTPDLVAAVWMGYPPDPSTGKIPEMTRVRGRRVTGGSFPATIWQKFMREAVKETKPSDFVEPKLNGEELQPLPTPCPDDPPPGADAFCIPSPSPPPALPSPHPSGSPLPAVPSATPFGLVLPSPSPSPSPSP